MNGGICSYSTGVIAIEDNDEDVEVVFSNINKTHIHRNVTYLKISREIELLKAMSKHAVPKNFYLFKDFAKKLGFKHHDDVIMSAWERLMKKVLLKSNILQTMRNVPSNYDVHHLAASPQAIADVSPLPADTAPSISRLSQTPPLPSASPPKASEVVPVALLMNKTIVNKSSGIATKRKSEGAVKSEQAIGNSIKNRYKRLMAKSNSECKEPPTMGTSDSRSEGSVGTSNSACNDSVSISFNIDFPLTNMTPGNNTKKSAETYQKRKSSSKPIVSVDSSKTEEQAFVKSHVGVQAKIIKTTRASTSNSNKLLRKNLKQMSDVELKKFKAEQKILKQQRKREFEIEQLQKVHDRLVDVLIPKYYNKDTNEKS